MVQQIERADEEGVRDRRVSVRTRGVRDLLIYILLPARTREDERLMQTAYPTRTWTDEISFVSCQLVSSNHRRGINYYVHRFQEEGNRSRINYLQRSCPDARS